MTGVAQGSIPGILLFNIFINDLFLFIEISNVCNYANDNTLLAFGKILTKLPENFKMIF